jgi:hypothetical protein
VHNLGNGCEIVNYGFPDQAVAVLNFEFSHTAACCFLIERTRLTRNWSKIRNGGRCHWRNK